MTRTPVAASLLSLALTLPGAVNAGSVSGEIEGPIGQVAPREIAIPTPGTRSRPNADEVVVLLEAIGASSGPTWSPRLGFEWAPAAEADAPEAAKSIEFSVGGLAMATPEGVFRAAPTESASGVSSPSLPTEPPYRALALVGFSLLVLGSALALRRR